MKRENRPTVTAENLKARMTRVFSVVKYLGAIMVAALAVTTCIDVTGRYLFDAPLPIGFELSTHFFLAAVACGIAVATFANTHISIDTVYDKLSSRWQRILMLVVNSIGCLIFSVFSFENIVQTRDSITSDIWMTASEPPFPIYPFLILLSLGFLLSTVAMAYAVIHPSRPGGDVKSVM